MNLLATAACGILAFSAACPTFADPLRSDSIPLDTRWVLHVDVDAARDTPLWNLARLHFVEPRRALLDPQIQKIQAFTGMSLPTDLHDVTLYGGTYDETSVCILIHANINQPQITTLLKLDKDFNSEDHNGHTVLTWREKDRDRLMYVAFAPGNVAILSTSPKLVHIALDTIDGKSPSLKPGSPLTPSVLALAPPAAARAPRQPFFWVAGENLSELPRDLKESPILNQIEAASIAINWANDKASTQLRVRAKSEKAAQQMLAVAEGVKAMVALTASDDHPLPRIKVISAALQDLVATVDGKTVKGDWSIGIDKLEALVDIAQQDAMTAVHTNAPPQKTVAKQP